MQSGPDAKARTVLVVDDEEPIRVALGFMLERLNYRVVTAENAKVALAAFENRSAEIQLVITDAKMPQMDGKALAAAIRQIRPDVPVIAMSGLHDPKLVQEFAEVGVTQFLGKPFTLDQLTRVLAAVSGPGTGAQGAGPDAASPR